MLVLLFIESHPIVLDEQSMNTALTALLKLIHTTLKDAGLVGLTVKFPNIISAVEKDISRMTSAGGVARGLLALTPELLGVEWGDENAKTKMLEKATQQGPDTLFPVVRANYSGPDMSQTHGGNTSPDAEDLPPLRAHVQRELVTLFMRVNYHVLETYLAVLERAATRHLSPVCLQEHVVKVRDQLNKFRAEGLTMKQLISGPMGIKPRSFLTAMGIHVLVNKKAVSSVSDARLSLIQIQSIVFRMSLNLIKDKCAAAKEAHEYKTKKHIAEAARTEEEDAWDAVNQEFSQSTQGSASPAL